MINFFALKRLLVVAILFPATVNSAVASGQNCVGYNLNEKAKTIIIFINGIINLPDDACASTETLISKLSTYGVDTGSISWKYWYNPTSNDIGIGDIDELRVQAILSQISSNKAASESQSEYYKSLGATYDDLLKHGPIWSEIRRLISQWPENDKKNQLVVFDQIVGTTGTMYDKLVAEVEQKARNVVLVPHSQGNFYVEAVHALLMYRGKQVIADHVKVVGVATISKLSPSNHYITIEQDAALFKLQAINTVGISGYSPAKPLHTACAKQVYYNIFNAGGQEGVAALKCSDSQTVSTFSTLLRHEFVDVYLNEELIDVNFPVKQSLPKIIVDNIASAIDQFQGVLTYATNNHRYELITCGTWSQCRDAALAKGGSLVTVRNQAENDWLVANLLPATNGDYGAWIGLSDAASPGTDYWQSREPVTYTNWTSGNPSRGPEHYVHIYRSGSRQGEWNDLINDSGVTQAVVEYGPLASVVQWKHFIFNSPWRTDGHIVGGWWSYSDIAYTSYTQIGSSQIIRIKLPSPQRIGDLSIAFKVRNYGPNCDMHLMVGDDQPTSQDATNMHSYPVFYECMQYTPLIEMEIPLNARPSSGVQSASCPDASSAYCNQDKLVNYVVFYFRDPKEIDYLKVRSRGNVILNYDF